jgi:hypothetical protein
MSATGVPSCTHLRFITKVLHPVLTAAHLDRMEASHGPVCATSAQFAERSASPSTFSC